MMWVTYVVPSNPQDNMVRYTLDKAINLWVHYILTKNGMVEDLHVYVMY